MKTLVCLLEEPSAREMLRSVLPRILPVDVDVKFIIFEGKQDLERQMERRLRYWQVPDSLFLVMRDQDSGDCRKIKTNLEKKVVASGKHNATLIRVACHELESFYLGDLAAVENGLTLNGLSAKQNSKKFRTPDTLSNAAEELLKLTKKQYQKISGSRSIAPHLKIDGSNRSHSFNILLNGIKKLTDNHR